MSKRITITDLKDVIKERNTYLLHSGSNIFYMSNPRNGYNAVDLCFINERGQKEEQCNVQCGTPSECINSLYDSAKGSMGKVHHGSTITRKTAKRCLLDHIDFNLDPAQLSQSDLELLHKWAKITKYAKPVNFSRGFGFFLHLQNRVKL